MCREQLLQLLCNLTKADHAINVLSQVKLAHVLGYEKRRSFAMLLLKSQGFSPPEFILGQRRNAPHGTKSLRLDQMMRPAARMM